MTRLELLKVYNQVQHCRVGYCCHFKDGISEYDLINLGFNHGIYGWNWTAFLDLETNTLYISCYRNVPGYIKEK